MPRILIAEGQQEVSSFNPIFSHYQDFDISLGDKILAIHRYSQNEVSGALSVFDEREDISIVPTFILTPLTYLGGIFYSIHLLPDFWQGVSLGNPILYMINAFRFGFLGISDISLWLSYLIIGIFILVLFAINLIFLGRGHGIRH